MSRRPLLAITVLVASLVLPASGSTVAADLVGDAYDRSGQLRYREYHEFDSAPRPKQSTVYRDPDGREIGRMEALYSADPFAPAYRMVDHRHDSEEIVRREGDVVHVEHRLGDKRRTKALRLDAARPLVVGPGFNDFIKANWDALLEGRTLVCDFVIPSRLQLVSFRIRHTPGDQSDNGHRFTVSADNVLLRLLAPELTVEYDRQSRRLLSYAGPSNVNDDRNGQQDVIIRYLPPTGAAQVASAR